MILIYILERKGRKSKPFENFKVTIKPSNRGRSNSLSLSDDSDGDKKRKHGRLIG